MKIAHNHRYYMYMLLALLVGSTSACKKKSVGDEGLLESPATGTRGELTLDSIFLYAKHTYLWNEELPSYTGFNPRKYVTGSGELVDFKTALFGISRYALNPATRFPYEQSSLPGTAKYAYLESGAGSSGTIAALPTQAQAAASSNRISFLISGEKGYLKLTEFSHPTVLNPPLDNAFQRFADARVTELVIDLRGNSGGYVETATYLANLIASPTLNGQVMFSQHFNTQMQQAKAGILKNQVYLDENSRPVYTKGRLATYADVDFSVAGNTFRYEKKGTLTTVKSLNFLVNGGTASASELLINSLKPYFELKLLGSKTYGKPVGAFGIKIDRYMLYVPNFLIKNARGESDYFGGMPVDFPLSDAQIGTAPLDILENVALAVKGSSAQSSERPASATEIPKLSQAFMVQHELRLLP